MKLQDADVIWTPTYAEQVQGAAIGSVRVEPHLSGWQRTPGDMWEPAACAFGAGFAPRKSHAHTPLLSLFILFNTLVIRDGIDAKAAHSAFLAIDEYRETISPDTPGAERQ